VDSLILRKYRGGSSVQVERLKLDRVNLKKHARGVGFYGTCVPVKWQRCARDPAAAAAHRSEERRRSYSGHGQRTCSSLVSV
jgi:hypothetical protein